MLKNMSAIEYTNDGFRLSLEPLEIEGRTSSIAFSIEIELKTKPDDNPLSQSMKFNYPHVWIETDELDRFEKELSQIQEATLRDMSDYVLFAVRGSDASTELEINPRDERMSSSAANINSILLLAPRVKKGLANTFKEYPKWW
ncbi:hypothetical protein H5232_23415 [Pseudoalteromonas sp. SG41-5]|nr:hypothetical protein [Pseudoalteromonas sp. SG41-5]MBB1471334.1 hypothetical protein [Pseudoalteromonas sp. SG41-5]